MIPWKYSLNQIDNGIERNWNNWLPVASGNIKTNILTAILASWLTI